MTSGGAAALGSRALHYCAGFRKHVNIFPCTLGACSAVCEYAFLVVSNLCIYYAPWQCCFTKAVPFFMLLFYPSGNRAYVSLKKTELFHIS